MNKPFFIQDPKTFDKPNYNLVDTVVEKFFIGNKENFLSTYYQLSNTDKFYAIVAICLNFIDIDVAKKMLLEELRPDLVNLKVLNKPNDKDFGFGYEYKGYDFSIWENINRVKIPQLS